VCSPLEEWYCNIRISQCLTSGKSNEAIGIGPQGSCS
jgi:hypothetical protein